MYGQVVDELVDFVFGGGGGGGAFLVESLGSLYNQSGQSYKSQKQ